MLKQIITPHILPHRRSTLISYLRELTPSELFPYCLRILSNPPKDRNNEELNILRKATSNIKFFEQVSQEEGEFVLINCLKHLTLEIGSENTILFEKGEKGDKFYIILSGRVGVYINAGAIVEENGSRKSKRKSENKTLIPGIRPSAEQPNDVRKSILKCILEQLSKVNQLGEGDSFGEMALINEGPRLASIVCETDCTFGVLSKQAYKDILQQKQAMKIQQQIQELQLYAGFQNLSKKLLTILLYAFKSVNYTFREAVYKQGSNSNQEIYLIQSGEFIITQKYSNNRIHKIAILEKGSIFGDIESFKNQELRVQSVYCNSDYGKVLQIELSTLLKRLQSSNEMHLYEELQKACETKEKVRNMRYSMFEGRQLKIQNNQQKRISIITDAESTYQSLDQISQMVKTKKKLFKKLYRNDANENVGIFDFLMPKSKNTPKRNYSVQCKSRGRVQSRGTIQRIVNNSHISKSTQKELVEQCESFIQQQMRNKTPF